MLNPSILHCFNKTSFEILTMFVCQFESTPKMMRSPWDLSLMWSCFRIYTTSAGSGPNADVAWSSGSRQTRHSKLWSLIQCHLNQHLSVCNSLHYQRQTQERKILTANFNAKLQTWSRFGTLIFTNFSFLIIKKGTICRLLILNFGYFVWYEVPRTSHLKMNIL